MTNVSNILKSKFNEINTEYKSNVENYLEIARKCSDAHSIADKNKYNITSLIEGLTMGKSTFYKFVKIGKSDLRGNYGDNLLSKVNDYNILEILSKDNMLGQDDASKSRRLEVQKLVDGKEKITRDVVNKITSGATDNSNDKGIDTDTYNKVVASIRVDSNSFFSLEDIDRVKSYIKNLLKDKKFEFGIAIEEKDFEKSLENEVKNALKYKQNFSQRFGAKNKEVA